MTINYRLGWFGFFSHSELTSESPNHVSGNQGILDQIAALQWVRANIARFGGDPGNVTIFGESSGSLDVSVLMASPLSRGLLRRVIGESGAVTLDPAGPLTLMQAEKQGQAAAARWGISSDATLKDLRAVSAAEILKTQPGVGNAMKYLGVIADGYVFPKRPADVFAAGKEHHVALLLGNNSHEWGPGRKPPVDLKKTIEDIYGPIAQRALELYGGEGSLADQWATDTSFRCSAVLQLVWHASAGNASFEYQFDRAAPGRESLGATHATELQYVFGTFDGSNPFNVLKPTFNAVDRAVSEAMQQYWTNFAKTGNPNGGSLPQWPRFDVASRAYIEFRDAGPVAREGLRRPFCDLYIEHVKQLMRK